jgi:hypothetical protein
VRVRAPVYEPSASGDLLDLRDVSLEVVRWQLVDDHLFDLL